jgi:hypothetical protein
MAMSYWPLTLALVSLTAQAKIVVLNIDLPLDQGGDHNQARIFYDDATIDASRHVVRVLQMQWLEGGRWQPQTLDPVAMPMTDAWLHVTAKSYRYHYRAALTRQGLPVLVEFDEKAGRFAMLMQKDRSVVLSAPYQIAPASVTEAEVSAALRAPPAYVILNMYVTVDQVAAGEASHVGDVDRLRVVYDANAIDPDSKRVPLINLQHFIGGAFNPPHPDAVMMPTNDAWLDLNSAPYRLHYRAQVTHGKPIVIEIDEHTRRLSISSRQEPAGVLISGTYGFDPVALTGPEATAAATVAKTDADRPAAVTPR